MHTNHPTIHRDPETGLLCTVQEGEATIVGCTDLAAVSVEIPPVILVQGVSCRVTAIGESAFAYMSNLQRIVLPSSLRRIDHGAFEASGLTEVQLPGSLEIVAPYAFYGCSHLIRLALPASAAFTLEEHAFEGCSALHGGDVANAEFYSGDALARSGLSTPAAIRVVYVDGVSTPEEKVNPAQARLNEGLAHEAGGDCTAAADAYMQAHAFRDSLGRMMDHDARMATLRAVSEAEYRLALLLKFGLAPLKNPDGTDRPSAVALLEQLTATANHSGADYHLGDIYAGGYGVTRDAACAAALLRKAANAGHERACLDLGYACLYGTLEAANRENARHFFAKCAEMDGPYAYIAQEELDKLGRW